MAVAYAATRMGESDGEPNESAAMAQTIRTFLVRHTSVRIREGGRIVARLEGADSGFALNVGLNQLVCHLWSADCNLVRRVVSVTGDAASARLRLQCLRMGRSRAEPMDLETASAAAAGKMEREEFRHALEAAALREWRGWQLETGPWTVGAARSPLQRLLLRRSGWLLPCVAVSDEEPAAAVAQALPQLLAWTAQVLESWPKAQVKALRLVVPPGAEVELRQRCRWLRQPPVAPAIECFRLDRSAGLLHPVDLHADGNLNSELRLAPSPAHAERRPASWLGDLLREVHEYCPQATLEAAPEGNWLFRQYGLEFARAASELTFGAGGERTPLNTASRPQFLQMLRQLGRERVPGGDRRDWFYSLNPESWLEHLLRSDPTSVDPQLAPAPVYRQVPVCRAGGRDVLDLLAVDRSGRLAVMELKTDEDLGFPLQALDYWARVRRHLEQGDFTRLGYFPGRDLSPLCPRLLLIAPALRWHPRVDAVFAAIAPEVPRVRIGLNEDWRRGVQVVYRKVEVVPRP